MKQTRHPLHFSVSHFSVWLVAVAETMIEAILLLPSLRHEQLNDVVNLDLLVLCFFPHSETVRFPAADQFRWALVNGGGSSKAFYSFNSSGKQEITALFNDGVAIYKNRREGTLPPELKTIREYLRELGEQQARSTTPAVNPAPKKSRD